MHRSLMYMLEEYDRNNSEYIEYLESEINRLKEENMKLSDLALKTAETSAGTLLHAILNGAFDKSLVSKVENGSNEQNGI